MIIIMIIMIIMIIITRSIHHRDDKANNVTMKATLAMLRVKIK